MINGAGFNSHPEECDLFVHCYFGEQGLRAMIRRCPFGQFWNQTILSCQYSERSFCAMGKFSLSKSSTSEKKVFWILHWITFFCIFCFKDRCSYIRDPDYEEAENCRAYWECSNGVSRGRCCRYGFRYAKGVGCVQDSDNSCRKSCPMDSPLDLRWNDNGKHSQRKPWKNLLKKDFMIKAFSCFWMYRMVTVPTPACDKIPIANDMKHYQQLLPGTGYVTMPCAEGTHYNERKCKCTQQEPGYPTFKEPSVQEPVAGKFVGNYTNLNICTTKALQWITTDLTCCQCFKISLSESFLLKVVNLR